jgi:transketolase
MDAPVRNDLANVLRALAMDAVQQANSGHPGMPMGMAEIALALWNRQLRHNPADPKWPNRDRFVLSRRPLGDSSDPPPPRSDRASYPATGAAP